LIFSVCFEGPQVCYYEADFGGAVGRNVALAPGAYHAGIREAGGVVLFRNARPFGD